MRGRFFGAAALVAGILAIPAMAAAATLAPLLDRYCAADSAETYRFDRGLTAAWLVSERPTRTTARPYPDGSIDGDIPGNVQSAGGVLHLLARRAGDGFTGSRVLSRARVRYGCVEIVAKLPRGRGFWPALWLRTPYDGSPINGEIDVAEGFGSHPGVFMSTLHHWQNGVDADRVRTSSGQAGVSAGTCAKVIAATPQSVIATGWALARARLAGTDPRLLGNWLFASYQNRCALVAIDAQADFARDFHRYTIVWTPDRLIWALDGRAFFEASQGVPQVAMMVVMGLSVGALDGGVTTATPALGDLQIRSVAIRRLRGQ